MYRDSVYVYALQTVSTQATRVRLFSSAVESYTPVKHAALASNTLTFGPYDRPVAALTPGSALSVHAENNAPFATMRAATREFRVSHWGHVNVEENYLLAHTGAKLRGEFLRSAYEGHIPAARGQHAFERLAMFLPLAATDISFRDAIGNVSTSHVRPEPVHRRTLVELRTRYPLFGGWTADLEVGYRLPVQDVLSAVPGSEDLVLELPFGLPLEGVAADELAVRVVLPEGAADIRWDTPFDVDGVSEGTVMTSLDTAGRPVLEIRKVNVVAGHWKPFRVAYRFPRVQLWREPMLLVLAVFLVLGLVMVWVRLDFSIGGAVETEDDDEVVQEQEKVVAKKETKSEAKKADQGKHRSDKKKK
jgi:oligosaccharyltransferase complex subunit alpha (ribophorin I)